MSLENVLTKLAEAQVNLWPEGDHLHVQAPKGALTVELRALLVEHKSLLLQHLRRPSVDRVTLPILEQWPDDRYRSFPLTDIQQAYWLGRQQLFELGNVACQTYLEIEGRNLDLARLGQAWQALINRHAMLRVIVLPTGEQQILEDVPPYEIKCVDLSGIASDAAATRMAAIRRDMTQRVAPTDQWPLFDIHATRLDEERIRLHIRVDMLTVDVSSTMLLFQEWGQLYQNPACRLPELSLSFRDYVLTAEKLEMMEPYRQSQAYWLDRLDSLPPAPELPRLPDQMTPDRPQFKRYTARLEAEPWTRLRQRAGQAGLTPTGVLLTAFADILAVWSRHPRFTLNLTVFNRLPVHPQVNDIVGDFTSTILLAVDNTPATPFMTRAQRLQQQLWQDLEHRYFSGTRVLRELARRSGGETNSLMPVVFTSTLGVGSADFLDFSTFGQLVHGSTQTPQVWLDHQLFEQNGALVFNWDVVEELFPPDLLAIMFESYCRWLKRLATEETAWTEIDQAWLPPEQLTQRRAINDTVAPVSEALLHTLFLPQVEARAGAEAVITPHYTLTYQALYDRANGLGHWLRAKDVKPNTLVAVVMKKGWEQVVAVLGILMSGAAYLPIDPALPPERQRFLLEQGEVNIALTQSQLAQTLTWPEGVEYLAVDTATLPAGDPLAVRQRPTDLAYVIYTSGSTGLPKGVMIDHRGAVNTILDLNERFDIGPQDRVLALSNLNFDLSVYDVFGTLAAGGTIVMPDAARTREPAHWAAMMAQHRVTLWNSVPALMQMLVETLSRSRPSTLPDLSALHRVWLSGDWIPIDLPDQIRTVFAEPQIISMGGATEASIWSILYPVETVDPTWPSIPYGKPMRNQTFHVLNERFEPCPIWVPGELYIGGIGVAKGYWRDEAKTQARFITHPHNGERLYRTGDLGRYLPDGNIEFLGREDFQVKIRGHRIELGEIETNLIKHPAIQKAVVTTTGQRENQRLVAYLVLEQNSPSREQNGSKMQAGRKNQSVKQTPTSDSLHPGVEGILTDPAKRLEFKLKQPGIRRLADGYTLLEFQPPAIDEAAYLTRQSYRQFLAEPVPFAALGQVLTCLMPHHFSGSPLPKYRYPSAGNLYPVQVYLYLKPERIVEAAGGFYYYHPLEHRLILLSTETNLEDEIHAVVNREIFEQSAFSLFLVADLAAIEPMYGPLARDFCLLEAGYMSQILMEVAPGNAIGLCPIGDLTFTGLQTRFELTDRHLLLHSFVGGGISPEQRQILPQPEAVGQTALSETAIKEYLAQTLPAYMIPATYVFLDHLPLTPNGKVDRKALPEPEIHLTEQDFVLPQTEIEQTLARIVQTTLQIDEVGLYHNFFDLGADSLGLVHIQVELQTTFEQDIPLTTMFNHPTISSLAAYLGAVSDQETTATLAQSTSERTAAIKVVKQRRERQRHNREKIR